MTLSILMASALFSVVAGVPQVQEDPEPGKWCDNIKSCTAFADLYRMPMLAIWGSSGCRHCKELAEALTSEEFISWASQRKIVMCYGEDDDACKKFCRTGSQKLQYYPFVCVYWNTGDGNTLKQNFTGMRSTMPVDSEPTLAGCLISSVETFISDYTYTDPKDTPVSFSLVDRKMLVVANEFLCTKRTAVIPLFPQGSSPGRLDGILTVSLTAGNRISAKYTGASPSKTLAFSGTWATIDLRNGEVVCNLTKNGNGLTLKMSNEGVITASLEFLLPFFGATASGTSAALHEGSCNGTYTVLFKPDSKASGVGYATVTLKGTKATVKGVLPDGTALSGNFTAFASGEGVLVPVFKRSNKILFGAAIAITPSETGMTVSSALESVAYVCDPLGEHLTDLSIGGCGADIKMGPTDLLDKYGFGEICTFAADLSAITDSDYGEPAAIDPVELLAEDRKFTIAKKGTPLASFTYKTADATFGGKLNLTFGGSRRISATIKGVFAPGMEKDSIIGRGTAYFKDRVGGANVTRSVPVTISAKKNQED